jgi:hypothetical protein
MLNEKWEYIEPVQQLFIDFRKACDSVSREVVLVFSLSLMYS